MPRLDYTVLPEEDGAQVYHLLRQRLHLSTALLRRLKTVPDGILLDGAHVTVRVCVRAGQVLSILPEPEGFGRVPPEPGPLDVAYEDADLLIVCKPSGLAVHPSPGHSGGTLANYVAAYLDGPAFHAVNRLDRGTSGLMCIAKHKLAAQRLGRAVQDGTLRRQYHAVAEGVGLPPEGTVDAPIGRVEGNGIRRTVCPDGQRAVTHFVRLAEGPRRTLLALRLETGRTHQIRVHLASLGHPITGDFLYGTELDGLPGFLLHSCRIELTQPMTGVPLCVTAPDPPCFAQYLNER